MKFLHYMDISKLCSPLAYLCIAKYEKRKLQFLIQEGRYDFRNEIMSSGESRGITEVKESARFRQVGVVKLLTRNNRHCHFLDFVWQPPLICHEKIYILKIGFSLGTENLVLTEDQVYFPLLPLLSHSLLKCEREYIQKWWAISLNFIFSLTEKR